MLDRYVDRIEAAMQGSRRQTAPTGQLLLVAGRHPVTSYDVSAHHESVTEDVLAASKVGASAGAVAAAAAGLAFKVVDAGMSTGDLVTSDALSADQVSNLIERGRGLGAGVWSRNAGTSFRMGRGIQAGRVWTNCYHAYPAHAAFGGYKASGIGRENHKMMQSRGNDAPSRVRQDRPMSKKRRVPPQDAMFLWTETPETMMHVASLMPFTPPANAGPTYLRDVLDEAREEPVLSPWNMKLTHPFLLRHPLQAWVEDENFDFDYHVRRSALASPGDERELGILVSRLHSHQLDFTRPPWELHVIEGLEGGRFALYTKVHHALVDGFTAVKMLGRSLSEDPESKGKFFFSLDPPKRSKPPKQSASLVSAVSGTASGVAKGAFGAVGSAAGVAKAVAKLELSRGEEHKNLKGGWSAPDSILNQRTSRTRRFATQQFDTSRFKAIAKASGGTLNDVVMAVCGGGLRAYLEELGELPEKPLVAFVPVNIREEGDEGGGNKVAVLMASMGTDVEDPVGRLEAVIDSTSQAKKQMAGLGQVPALAYSGYLLAPSLAQTLAAIAGVKNPLPTTFNLVLSNVPGPKKTLYLRGSRLEAVYPVSIPAHGMALNITLETYADTMNFGFIGDREAVPHLQRLAVYTGEALIALERGLGLPPDAGDTRPSEAPDKREQPGAGPSAVTRAALAKPGEKRTAKKAPAQKSATD